MSLEKFIELESEFAQNYQALVAERDNLNKQLQDVRREHNVALERDVMEGTKATKTAVDKAKQAVQDVQNALNDVEQRIVILQRLTNERLQALFPAVEQELKQELTDVREAILDESEAMKRLRAEVILQAKRLYDIGQVARDKYYTVQQVANRLGVKLGVRFELPAVPLTAMNEGISQPLMPLEHEVRDAYLNGKLAFWVRWYEQTGEIIHDEEARVKLQRTAEGE
jgi:hypothetical protein